MLEVDSLTKRYANGVVGLRDVSLSVAEGVLGLLGPNGAGKTTLMSILATVSRPTSGTFRLEGQDGVANPYAIRARLGYLPQDFGIYGKLTAREFISYLARLKGVGGADLHGAVGRVLDLVNLHGVADRRLEGFSGGMRQRVGVAQALLGDPKLIIVDEPSVGLDPEERIRFRNLLADIAQGRIVVLSTHIVSDLEAVASRIAVVEQGRLVVLATPGELLARAQGHVFSCVVSPERLPAAQRSLRISGLVRRSDGVHVRFVGSPSSVHDAVRVEPTLEDAYLALQVGAGLA